MTTLSVPASSLLVALLLYSEHAAFCRQSVATVAAQMLHQNFAYAHNVVIRSIAHWQEH